MDGEGFITENKSKSRLFLIELIIIIVFFSLSAAVCVRMFASAYNDSRKSTMLSHSVTEVTSIAECLKSGRSVADLFASTQVDGQCTVFYDSEWNNVSDPDADYRITISQNQGERLSTYEISAFYGETFIYGISLSLCEGAS